MMTFSRLVKALDPQCLRVPFSLHPPGRRQREGKHLKGPDVDGIAVETGHELHARCRWRLSLVPPGVVMLLCYIMLMRVSWSILYFCIAGHSLGLKGRAT